jgi:hypothetical protein
MSDKLTDEQLRSLREHGFPIEKRLVAYIDALRAERAKLEARVIDAFWRQAGVHDWKCSATGAKALEDAFDSMPAQPAESGIGDDEGFIAGVNCDPDAGAEP